MCTESASPLCDTPSKRRLEPATAWTAPWRLRAGTLLVSLATLSLMAGGCPTAEVAEAGPERPEPMSSLSPERRQILEEYRALALQNDCSGAYRGLDGRWTFVGDNRVADYGSVYEFRGDRFTETLQGRDASGRLLEGRIEGEIRCLFKNRVLVTLDTVSPEGIFDNYSGEAYPCDILGDMDPNTVRILMICYFNWDLRTAAGREFEYERVD